MWLVKYGDKYLHDPRVSVFVTDATLSPEVNTSGEFKFTITKKHSLYETLREHDMDNEVTVYDDDDLIFCGTIVEIDKDFQFTADVTCQGEMSYLNKSLIPPFSTLSTESGETAPDNLAEFFEWLIEKHNSQVDARRQFVVGRNDGSSIVEGTFYLSSDSYSSTGSVIKNDILENYTSYITIEHEDDKRVINLLKDFDPVNAQVIDFGVNLLDFTDGVVSDEVYTVMIPLGAAMKDTEYDYFDGYSLTEDTAPDSSKQYYTHDTYTQATLKNVGTEDAPVYQFEDGVRYFEKVAKYTYTYAPWDSCNPNVTYYYNNKLGEKKNLYYFEYGYQYFETDGNGNYWATGDRTPNWDKTYYRYDYSSVSDLQHFSMWEDGDRSGYDYYTRKASEFFIATSDSSPVHGKTYYTSPSSVSYTACDVPLLKFEGTKSYFEYDGHADESNQKLTLSAGQFETQLEDGYIKTGDKVIATDAVKKYGSMTTTYENTDITTRDDLEKYGLIALKATVSPIRSLEIKAIDLAMIKPDYESIKIGQYVRARSKPHDLDSYFLCSKIDYDLNNPDNNTFTLGTTFDTLTGQQNKRIKALNATVNTVYEAAAKISDEAKANATIAGQAQEKIDDANAKADDAQTKADEAQKKADEAQSKADSAVNDAKDAADKAADAAKKADDATANVTLIQNRIATIEGNTAEAIANAAAAKEAADSAKADAEAANTAASNAQSAAESAQSKADEAYTAAGNAQSQVGKINEEITDIKQNATDLRDDLEGQIETITNTMTVDYAKKTDLSSVESSLKTEISTSAAGIKSEVSQTYATKTELNSIQVGGRNLVLDSKVEATSAAYGFGVRSLSISLEPNTEYIFSINGRTNDDKTSDDGKYLLAYIYSTDWAWDVSVSIPETSDTTRSVSFTTPDNISSKTINIESFYYPSKADSGVTPAGTCTVNWYKLEKGNKATDWTPAPEDVDSSIADLANNVETNYSTKSEVKQLSDQITSTVSSVEEVRVSAAAAQQTASDATTAAKNAQSAADAAKTNASNAQSAADAAKTAADAAQSKANEAAKNLETAEKNLQDLQSQADATDEQLSAAQTAVANVKKAADAAQSAADTAKANAETAQSTADTAKANAETAQTTANTAKTAAEKAQSDVDSLKNRVTTAETKISQNAEAITLRATKTEVSEVKSTADTAKSTADTVKTNLANNYSTTTQMNAAIKTSADSITSTVSKTYQVKGDYATNSSVKNTLRTYSFAAASGNNNHWTHIGDWQSNDNNSCHVIVYSGNGYNAGTNQNSVIDIFIKDGWQSSGSTTSAYAATVTLDQATQNEAKVKIIATAANKCQVWLYTSWSYGYGYYTIDCHPSSTWTNVSTMQEAEPSGASQVVAYRPNAGDNAAEIEKTQTQLTQTDQEIRMDFTKSIASASSDLQSQMDANNTATNQKLSEINKYIRFVDGKIVLGETGNELMLTIQNDRVSFTQAGVEVAYFSNNNLYVKRAEILTTMKIGNYEFTPRNDGGLALRKRSE